MVQSNESPWECGIPEIPEIPEIGNPSPRFATFELSLNVQLGGINGGGQSWRGDSFVLVTVSLLSLT